MRITEVKESKVWVHKPTGQRVGAHSACPWYSESERGDWELRTVGWTWVRENGTVGLCRPPAKTRAEAVEVMDALNEKWRKMEKRG